MAKAKLIYQEIIQEMGGLTESPHLFEDLDMPDDNGFEMERNSNGDSFDMFDLSQLDGANVFGELEGEAVAHSQDAANGVCNRDLLQVAVACA